MAPTLGPTYRCFMLVFGLPRHHNGTSQGFHRTRLWLTLSLLFATRFLLTSGPLSTFTFTPPASGISTSSTLVNKTVADSVKYVNDGEGRMNNDGDDDESDNTSNITGTGSSTNVKDDQDNGVDRTTDNDGNGNERKGSEYEPLAPHPHAGARYPDGRYGYVADATAVRKQYFKMLEEWRNKVQDYSDGNGNHDHGPSPSPDDLEQDGDTFESHRMRLTFDEEIYNYACNKPIGEGYEGVEGFKVMQKVQIGGPPPQPDPITVNVTSSTENSTDASIEGRRLAEDNKEQQQHQPKPRVLCVIYTYEPHHATMVQAVVNTWAWKCDGFFAASTATNETLGAVDLPHLGKEAYGNMWQKTRSIWAYIHDHYVNDYDFFWLGGDDVGLTVENLRGVLEDHSMESNPAGANEQDIPVYLGHQIPQAGGNYFCGGGPGYVLNRVAVKRLIAEVLPKCRATAIGSAEDRFLSHCLRGIGILCGNTVDAKGQQRFLGMDPNFSATYKGDRGYFKRVYEWWGQTNGGFKCGIDIGSEQMTGFHNLRYPAFMHRIYALQFAGTCPSNSTVGQTLNFLGITTSL